MKLNEIIENVDILNIHRSFGVDSNPEISDIIYDSRKVVSNCIFICLSGSKVDAHEYVNEAISRGAAAVLVEREISEAGAIIIRVKNTREALAKISAKFFGNPAEKLTTIGITGTKGKTTVSFMIKSILEESGNLCGLIGTTGAVYGGKTVKLENTTPESYEIQRYLSKMLESGCKYAVIEASSIGLKAHRLDGFEFDIGVFTNFSHDHIGGVEHKDMREYLECKSLLFRKCKTGIVNFDDENTSKIIENHSCEIQKFGMSEESDYKAKNINLTKYSGKVGIKFDISGKLNINDISVPVPGRFNAFNALAAASVCDILGISPTHIRAGLKNISVKGRIEPVPCPGEYSIFIDYAHNAVSMKNVLSTLREYSPKRLIVLFGAGGNRPKIRRYEMGQTAGELADLSIITSDNPRYENPMDIIKDIEIGMKKTNGEYIIIPDRKDAIRHAIEMAQKGDVIVLAGKGHEDYQEINGIKFPMDERVIVEDIFKKIMPR